MSIGTPQPSVLHLVTIFRQISAGEIRIPAFQREFVWKERQMIELLESVLEGFPIGSILLWNSHERLLRIAPPETTSFPEISEHFPTNYVLDGMQRLSTLYGVFHFGSTTDDPRFNILFDLRSRRFLHSTEEDLFTDASIPLAALFTPRQLLEHQQKLSVLPDADNLIEQLLALQAAFQDYMVPVVSIRSTDIHRIVGIFEKINSTGTKLDPVDFMRAITWAEDFDLNHYLDDVTRSLSELNFTFNLSSETLVKCVGMLSGLAPTTDGLLELRKLSTKNLQRAFEDVKPRLVHVAEFLQRTFKINSDAFVPYEGQLLLLFKTIGMQDASLEDTSSIARWFWATGFNESLRGKPDHYVVRALEDWKGLIKGRIRGLEPRLKLDAIAWSERRLVSGGALTATFIAMYAARGARDLITGEIIHPSSYTGTVDTTWFSPVLTKSELSEAGLGEQPSAKIFANVLLANKSTSQKSANWIEIVSAASKHLGPDVLATQFINRAALKALEENDFLSFIELRSELMNDFADGLVDEFEAY